MPTDTSNFTTPDVTTGNNGHQNTGKKWNPSAWNPQTQSMGAWEDTPLQQQATFDNGGWGGRGNDIDENGNDVAGTNGADRDRDRFRQMGQTPTDKTGPQIDQSASNETRNIGMGALGLLQQTAEGKTPSAAERAGTQMSLDAQHGLVSAGQSVRGGAMARAAGMRAATQNSGVLAAQQVQANAATRANEMAGARGAYFGAATGQRGQDLGIATTQAGLNEGQNALNDQHEAGNEDLAYGVQASQLDHQLGRSEQDANAAQQSHLTAVAGDEAARGRTKDQIGLAASAASGGISAYQAYQDGDSGNSGDGSNPNPDDTTSSEEAKTDIKPVNERAAARMRANARSIESGVNAQAEGHGVDKPFADAPVSSEPKTGNRLVDDVHAARLKAQADRMQSQLDANRSAAGLSTVNTPGNESAARGEAEPAKYRVRDRVRNGFDVPGYDNSMFKGPQDNADTQKLNDAIGDRVAHDNPRPGIIREDPYSQPAPDRALFGGGDRNVARARGGKPGAFGGPEASYDLGGGYSDGFHAKAVQADAPGTADFRAGSGRVRDPYSRAIMGLRSRGRFGMPRPVDITTSDARAKQDAFQAGILVGKSEQLHGDKPPAPRPEVTAEELRNTVAKGHRASGEIHELEQQRPNLLPDRPAVPAGVAPRSVEERAHIPVVTYGMPKDAYEAANLPGQAPPASTRPSEAVSLSDERSKGLVARVKEFFGGGEKKDANKPDRQMTSFQREFSNGDDAVAYSNHRDEDERRAAHEHLAGTDSRRAGEVSLSDGDTKRFGKGDGGMESANRSMAPFSYEYKPGFAEREGQKIGDKNVGPIAQNMKADPIASTVIVEDPHTGLLGIDKAKGLKLVMGGLADVQRQLDEVKGKKEKRT